MMIKKLLKSHRYPPEGMDDAVQMDIERKVGKIEPTIVIITSILVGIILVAVMLPLVNIMSSIG